MSVDSFRESDLVGRNLQRLYEEVEAKATSGRKEDYDTLKKFVEELDNLTSNSSFTIANDEQQNAYITVGTERINFSEAASKIFQLIEKARNNSASTEEHDARKKMFDEIEVSPTSLFLKADKVRLELAERGITSEELANNVEPEIEKSKDKIKELETLKKEKEKILEKFGQTMYSDSSKSYISKSAIDELKFDIQGKDLFEKVGEKLDRIQVLKNATASMSPTSTEYISNMQEIETLIGDVKGLAGDIKALDLYTSSFAANPLNNNSKFDLDYLNNLNVMSDFSDAKLKSDLYMRDLGNKIIIEDYVQLKNIIYGNNLSGQFKLPAQTIVSEEDILAAIDKFQDEVSSVESEIRYEKNYQAGLEKSLRDYRALVDKQSDLSSKLTAVRKQRPVLDENGRPVYETDENGRPVFETDANGRPVFETDANGRPVYATDRNGNVITHNGVPVKKRKMKVQMEEYTDYVPTDDTRKSYLADEGIADEAQYRQDKQDEARREAENEEQNLTNAEKRQLIRNSYRSAGGFHPLKWFRSWIAPSGMWDKGGYSSRYLSDVTARKINDVNSRIDAELNSKIAGRLQIDSNELADANAVIEGLRADFCSRLGKAAYREKMVDEFIRGTDEDGVKQGATVASSVETVGDVELLQKYFKAVRERREGRISEEEFNRIQGNYFNSWNSPEKDKMVNDRAYADKLSRQNTSRTAKTPHFRDEGIDEHTV